MNSGSLRQLFLGPAPTAGNARSTGERRSDARLAGELVSVGSRQRMTSAVTGNVASTASTKRAP